MTNTKLPALIGAAVGLIVFLGLALLPALLYGGYAGVLLASGISGTPIEPTLLVRALILFGMILGVTAVGFLCAVSGAAVGAAIGALLGLTPARKAEAKTKA